MPLLAVPLFQLPYIFPGSVPRKKRLCEQAQTQTQTQTQAWAWAWAWVSKDDLYVRVSVSVSERERNGMERKEPWGDLTGSETLDMSTAIPIPLNIELRQARRGEARRDGIALPCPASHRIALHWERDLYR